MVRCLGKGGGAGPKCKSNQIKSNIYLPLFIVQVKQDYEYRCLWLTKEEQKK